MKLKNKLLLAVGLAWIFFLVITYWSSQVILSRSFINLEHKSNEANLQRIDAVLNQASNSLATFTADWAHWNGIYAYMQGTNPNFINEEITIVPLINSNINFIMIWDMNHNLLWGKLTDFRTKQMLPLPIDEKFDFYFYKESPILRMPNTDKVFQGFIYLGDKIYLIAAEHITDVNKVKSPLGVLVTGRHLGPKLITVLEHLVKLNLKLITEKDLGKDKKLQTIFKELPKHKGHYQDITSEMHYQAYTLIKDVFGHPIAMIEISGVRTLYLSGLETIYFGLMSFIVFGLFMSFFLMFLIRVLIIEPIESLNTQVERIGEENELKRRITMPGSDELSSVASKVNSLLDIIQGSQEELEHRVEQRTKELKEMNEHLSQEIAERQSVEKELLLNKEHLLQLSHYDPLTSLPNRVFFNEILNKALNNAHEKNKRLAILFIDLDRFKNINETLGRQTGDLVIKEASHRFSSLLREGDVLARLGGDEFVILLNDVSDDAIINKTAEHLLAQSIKPIKINIHDLYVTASIGIVIFPEDGETLEKLQRNADAAMYNAKHSGGNIYKYFAKEVVVASTEKQNSELKASLRNAIDNKEFVLNFQPKLSLIDGSIIGIEALLRWENPELGMISPGKFIPIAEEDDLIIKIGEWALRQACFINKNWQSEGFKPLPIAVNLSPKQFHHPDLPDLIKKILQETKLEPRYLELEIPEKTVIDNIEAAINRLNILKDMGVAIAIDDFGRGYTSITSLKRFPIDFLKIDSTYIKGLPKSEEDATIARGIIALAHSLEFKVVAEGVETVEQMEFLSTYHCDSIQGYYISRPLSEKKIVLLFSKLNVNQETSHERNK